MAKEILTLADLGHNDSWLLVQQACGIPDARERSSFLENMTAVFFFSQESLPVRLCMTAAVRQMGGHVVYVGPGDWTTEKINYPYELSSIFNYYVDIVQTYGIDLDTLRITSGIRQPPLINGGCSTSHPINALADIACIHQYTPALCDVKVGWIGCANGTLHSLVEALDYFPFTLQVALPEKQIPECISKAQGKGFKVALVSTPEEAAQSANYICAGCLDAVHPDQDWLISQELLSRASNHVRVLLSASPLNSTPIDKDILQSKCSLLRKQAENRLRINKRMLPWVFARHTIPVIHLMHQKHKRHPRFFFVCVPFS